VKASRAWPLVLLVPLCAEAHSPIKGVMPFYGGMLHPFIVPAHVMAMIVIGLFIGRQPKGQYGRLLVGLLAPLVVGASLAGVAGDPDTDVPLLVSTMVIGVAVAWSRAWRLALAVAAVGIAALLIGLGSAPDGMKGTARGLHLAGSCLGVLVGVSWMCIVAEHVKRPWQQIAVRVVCSWVAASALLVLALTVFGPRKVAKPAGPSASKQVSAKVSVKAV
jgi:urease accessory protein